MSCWEKGTDNVFPATLKKKPENALITFIFINWGIIIHFTTNWSLGAPAFPLIKASDRVCCLHLVYEIYCSRFHYSIVLHYSGENSSHFISFCWLKAFLMAFSLQPRFQSESR